MRKLLFILFIVFCVNLLFADLEVNVPFDPNQVGPAYSTQGNYVYYGETFYVTNTAVTDTFYLNLYAYEIPSPWNMYWCHEGTCSYLGWGPWDVVLEENVEYDIHANIEVNNTAGSFDYQFVFNHTSLADSVVIDFSFRTEDASGIDELVTEKQIKLYQNHPNPFNPTTTISYNMIEEEVENTSIEIYNIKGQLIKTFTNLTASNNFGFVQWNGQDNDGKRVNSGIFFYKFNGVENSPIKKMVLIK